LEAVEGGGGEGDGHDEYDANNPGWQTLEQDEEGDGAVFADWQGSGPYSEQTGDADEDEDYEYGDRGSGDADVEVFVGAGGEGANPEVGEEEVVCENGDGEDVEELPAKEGSVEETGGFDEVAVDFGGHANSDGGDYDEEEDHGCLDVVGEEGDFETAESWRSQYWI